MTQLLGKLIKKIICQKKAIAECIVNNIRQTIIREHLTNPMFYDKMSKLLNDLIDQQRQSAKDYEDFLKKAEELIKKMKKWREFP
jgi:type I restriction enzyme R subunit